MCRPLVDVGLSTCTRKLHSIYLPKRGIKSAGKKEKKTNIMSKMVYTSIENLKRGKKAPLCKIIFLCILLTKGGTPRVAPLLFLIYLLLYSFRVH